VSQKYVLKICERVLG